MRSGVTPPTGKSGVAFGNTERHARTTSGGMASPGKSFNPDAPAFSASNASVIVATPGSTASPRWAARLDHGAIGVGRDHKFRARFRDFVNLARLEHRACADENLVAEQPGDDFDAH
jgi:hypothetical protein